MCDRREVARFLHAAGAQQGEAGGPHRHDVAVVAEDAERMGGEGARGHVHDGRRELTGDLEQVRHHQQQTLAGGEGGAQRTARDRAVQRAGSAGLALHLDHLGHHTPQVAMALRAPVVGELAHGGRGGDGIDGDHFAEEVGHACGGFVAVDHTPGVCWVGIGHEGTVRPTGPRQ